MIRQFRPEDASSGCELIQACLADDPSYSTTLREKFRSSETPQSIIDRARLFYIAVYELEGRILGLAGLEMNEIRLLYVAPEFQKRGIGRQLFEHLRDMIPGTLFADIFVYSSEQAAGFYRACGFIDKGPFTLHFDNEPLRTIFMAYPLCRGS